jgi:hypothetical protein
MTVAKREHRLHKRHELRERMHKAIDRFADQIADKIVRELKEHKVTEKKEHTVHHRKHKK